MGGGKKGMVIYAGAAKYPEDHGSLGLLERGTLSTENTN